MATVNVRSAYELLRRAMQQQNQEQQEIDPGSAANPAPDHNSGNYGSLQGGLLGRLLALQAEQRRYQPFAGDNERTPSEPPDPNFRQLSRAPIAMRPQAAIGPSNRPVDQSSPSYSPVGDSTSLDLSRASGQGAGWFGAYGDKPVPPWIVTSPTMTTVPLGLRGRGIPIPPMVPVPLPPIPMPTFPDWLRAAGKILQLYPRISSGMGGGGGDGGDDCNEEIRAARKICTDAFADGWKSDYDVGPYKTSSGKPWSIQDCMRGLISERCGGNSTDR